MLWKCNIFAIKLPLLRNNHLKATDNKCINPITVVRFEDLPEDGSVIKRINRLGKKPSDLTPFIIVDGERRYNAFQLLRKEYSTEHSDEANIFDRITVYVLTKEQAKKEEIYHNEANLQGRNKHDRSRFRSP